MFVRIENSLREKLKRSLENSFAYFVPGRIEFLGKHTDYAGGRSLICAIEKGFCLIAVKRDDAMIRVLDAQDNSLVEFPFSSEIVPSRGDWSNYPMTVARRVANNFQGARYGVDIAFLSDLPKAAGLSSSSAFMIGVFAALSDANKLEERDEYKSNIHSNEDLAAYIATIENGQSFGSLKGDKGVGTFGGSQDHTAIFCCRANHLSQYSFCPVRHEQDVELPDDYIFVVGVSGVVSEKTGDALEKYNRVSLRAKEILRLWNEATKRDDKTLASIAIHLPDELREVLSKSSSSQFSKEELLNRFEQFRVESEVIIPSAFEALKKGWMKKLGELIDISQSNAEKLLRNQIEETIYLARLARRHGAVASSAFGAGFGGSVYALIEKNYAEDFMSAWAEDYRAKFPIHTQSSFFFTTSAAHSLTRFSLSL